MTTFLGTFTTLSLLVFGFAFLAAATVSRSAACLRFRRGQKVSSRTWVVFWSSLSLLGGFISVGIAVHLGDPALDRVLPLWFASGLVLTLVNAIDTHLLFQVMERNKRDGNRI